MRSLTASSLPPSGPAKAARPFSRATASAALAAQPPPVMMKSEAATLAPGGGKLLDPHHDVLHRDAGAQMIYCERNRFHFSG